MTFIAALRTVSGSSFVYRYLGPVFHIDALGEITLIKGKLLLGDLLDMDDWRVSKRL
jgi:hypothetical protein